jgi:hypothetical protein
MIAGREAHLTRVFLAAYMIVCFPANAFERPNDPLERSLTEIAQRMLQSFEAILTSGAPPERFRAELKEYFQIFHAWKVPDERKLRRRICHALRAIRDAKEALGNQNLELREQIDAQETLLRDKLVQICGQQALDSFEAAMRASCIMPGAPRRPAV